MELDFTWLTKIAEETAKRDFCIDKGEKQAPETPQDGLLTGGEYKTLTDKENAVEGLKTPLEGMGRLQRRAEAEKADHERSLRVYREYQDNIKACGQLQTDILKGARAGADPYSLLLKAVEAIAKMTHNSLFYDQVKGDLLTIYGEALLEPVPLAWELEAVEERLGRLQQAVERETAPDSKQRIQAAIKAHRAEAERLRGLINQAERQKKAV